MTFQTRRLKFSIIPRREKTDSDYLPYLGLENIESFTGKYIRTEKYEPDSECLRFNASTILFNKLRPYLSKVYRPDKDGKCTGELLVLEPILYDKDYLFYLLLNRDFIRDVDASTYGSKMPRASWEYIGNRYLALPPLPVQKAIAAYLDRETARVDALIAKKERQIELLEEKRQAVITRAVTKGLDPNARMKDSGVEWIGEIPEGWGVFPLYAGYELKLGKMLDTKKISGDYLVQYLRNVDVQWDSINTDNLPQLDIDYLEREALRLHKGDLLVCEGGEIGKSAIWKGELDDCYFQKALHRIRPRSNRFHPRFLFYCLFYYSKRGVFSANSPTSTIQHLTGEKLRIFRFPLPSPDEQIKITRYIDSIDKDIKALIGKIEESIQLLREYRSSLITAAVSGQLDVSQEVVP